MRRVAVALVIGWLLGIGTGLAGVAVTGGWYEYRVVRGSLARVDAINEEGWHVVPGQADDAYLRRPRIRLGW